MGSVKENKGISNNDDWQDDGIQEGTQKEE
jgi:hypothetical protein